MDEAYTHLIEVHFPGSRPATDEPSKMLPRWVPSPHWDIAHSIIMEDRITWVFENVSPFKSPGLDGIYPMLL